MLPTQRLVRQLGLGGTLRLARLAAMPVRRLGTERFTGAGGPLLLAGNALHADLSPDGAGSALYGWLLTMLGPQPRIPRPGGWFQPHHRRPHRAAGGPRRNDPHPRSRRADRHLRRHRHRGDPRLGGRRSAPGARSSPTSPPPPLYRDLVGSQHLPPKLLDDLDHFEWDTPTLKIDWALSAPIPWTARDAANAGTVHLGVDLDGLTDYAADPGHRPDPHETLSAPRTDDDRGPDPIPRRNRNPPGPTPTSPAGST